MSPNQIAGYILIGLIFIGIGLIIVFNHEGVLRFRHRYDVKGKVEYTDWARAKVIYSGIFTVICGLIIFGAAVYSLITYQ